MPDGRWIEADRRWEGIPRDLALFYADLLGMQIMREDWLKIGWDRDGMHLAFGDGPTKNYLAPVWGDPERPPQVLLEIPAADIGLAGEFASSIGANLLEERERVRTYADPVGHPFRLYTDQSDLGTAERPLSGRIGRIVFQCFSPRALAPFWSDLVTMPLRIEDGAERVVVARQDRSFPMLGFEHAVVRAPRWPDPKPPPTDPSRSVLRLRSAGSGDG